MMGISTNPLQELKQLLELFKKWPGVILLLLFSTLAYKSYTVEDRTHELAVKVEKLTLSVQQYQAMVESKDDLLRKQSEIRNQHDKHIRKLIQDLQHSKNITGELQSLMAERDEALAKVERNIERKDEEIAQQTQQINELIDQNKHLKSQNDQLNSRVEELEAMENEFSRLEEQNDELSEKYQEALQEIDRLKKNTSPKVSFSQIITYANGYGDPDKEIKRTRKAKDIRFVRVLFRLDRDLELNEIVEVEITNNDFNRRNPLVLENITDDGEYFVDFAVRKRDIKPGILYARHFQDGELIGSRQVYIR